MDLLEGHLVENVENEDAEFGVVQDLADALKQEFLVDPDGILGGDDRGIVLELVRSALPFQGIEGQVLRDAHEVSLGFARASDARDVAKKPDEGLLQEVFAQEIVPAQGKDVVEHVAFRGFVKEGERGRIPKLELLKRSLEIHGHS